MRPSHCHFGCRYAPNRRREINLLPFSPAQFPRPDKAQNSQMQGAAYHGPGIALDTGCPKAQLSAATNLPPPHGMKFP
jgi:hypothetical protein